MRPIPHHGRVDADETVATFASLPTRTYLDTSVLQQLFDFGGLLWEDEPFDPTPRASKVSTLQDDLEALRRIFEVNDRAHFEFVVTAASLAEVQGRGDPRYTQWVRDVEDTWLIQSEGADYQRQLRQRLGSVSVTDWALIADALDTACDAFLTMDRPLASQAPVIERKTDLKVLTPPRYWTLLERWAALWQ